jgi:hypothetical protein
MRNYVRQAQTALEVYLNRGAQALEHARAGDIDKLNSLLTKRRAAFHNFRAADSIVSKYKQVGANVETAQDLWKQIRDIDELLIKEIQGIKANLAAQVTKFGDNRRKMNRYKSGKSKSGQVETPI